MTSSSQHRIFPSHLGAGDKIYRCPTRTTDIFSLHILRSEQTMNFNCGISALYSEQKSPERKNPPLHRLFSLFYLFGGSLNLRTCYVTWFLFKAFWKHHLFHLFVRSLTHVSFSYVTLYASVVVKCGKTSTFMLFMQSTKKSRVIIYELIVVSSICWQRYSFFAFAYFY